MKYLIIGAGGTGGPLGAYLHRAGREVLLIARGQHLQAIQEEGLRLEKAWEEPEVLRIPSCDMEHCEEKADVIFVCVKGYSLEETIPFIRRTAAHGAAVIPILNLYGTGRRLQKELPDLLVTDGCIYISANRTAPGVLYMHGKIFRVVYGLPDHRTDHPLLQKVREDLNGAGIEALYSGNIEKDALQKFSYVSPMAACGQFYGVEAQAVQKPGVARDLFVQLIDEIQQLAEAMGIHYEQCLHEVNLHILSGLAPTASTSMQRDIQAGRPSEIDGLIYQVERMAGELGISLPGYRMVAAELRRRGLH